MKIPLLAALQFLTVIPVRLPRALTPSEQGQVLLCYPVIGLGLGLSLAAAAWVLNTVLPPMPASALLLAGWAVVTGALHLDGLADTADGWLGGHGDRRRTLSIMRDSHSGAAAVVAAAVLLLIKFSALSVVVAGQAWLVLIAAPLAGRAAMPLLLAALPYARVGGIGAEMARALPVARAGQLAALSFIGVLLLCGLQAGPVVALLAVALPLGLLWLWARMLRARLGGTTGDTAGAALEAVEAAVLIAACVVLPG
ncbi:adenosylcobinamide-GDP ribazoletransferase [Algiphilus aromaticivorans]|jgi:adenosylcobinamide-GDP ribazoletransferase|uniref:adenosylcobinamide-GDP ribazoletransferase n=1 Tax=Algiphilus aromaticivorans TaxID=382454 RepID=UPI0005C1F5E3|nr:adenosylcobinamide-GDP ribazoletransferase [Algiphilus aromaticivorans]